VNVPEEFLEEIMDSVNLLMEPVHPGYDRTFQYSRVKGTWRPLEGSSPYKGSLNRIETADEIRLEFVVRGKDLKNVIGCIVNIHPYEEPAIDVIPALGWRDVI
ncbi:MAG: hypothetical protein LBE48_04770, partial [Methanomassiliicoccaceae archaeon]|jgi:hypothetical protein|nr:hypothetical protein [Methanomassiliicoccaceae archaeon]